MQPSTKLLEEFAPLSPIAGVQKIIAHQASDTFALWQAWEKELGVQCDTPFWAVVWPAAKVLGHYLCCHPEIVRGKHVLDLGCGCGVVSIAAAKAGAASVLANDIDPVALHMARLNADVNSVSIALSAADLTLAPPPAEIKVILIADMFYQQEPSSRLTAWLESAHARGARIIIADSGRTFTPNNSLIELYATDVNADKNVEGTSIRHVSISQWKG